MPHGLPDSSSGSSLSEAAGCQPFKAAQIRKGTLQDNGKTPYWESLPSFLPFSLWGCLTQKQPLGPFSEVVTATWPELTHEEEQPPLAPTCPVEQAAFCSVTSLGPVG